MLFRKAQDEDIPVLIDMALAFCRSTPMSKLAAVSEEKVTETFLETVIDNQGYCFVVETMGAIEGFIIGRLGELPFSYDKTGAVICWWVKKNKRYADNANGLFAFFEQACKKDGAKNVALSEIPGSSQAIRRLYERNKYTVHETAFIKDMRI